MASEKMRFDRITHFFHLIIELLRHPVSKTLRVLGVILMRFEMGKLDMGHCVTALWCKRCKDVPFLNSPDGITFA